MFGAFMVTLKVLRVDSVTVAKIAGLVAVIVPKLAVGAVIVPSSAIAKPVNVVLEQTKFPLPVVSITLPSPSKVLTILLEPPVKPPTPCEFPSQHLLEYVPSAHWQPLLLLNG